MKKIIVLAAALLVWAGVSHAQDNTQGDELNVYLSWEAMWDGVPDEVVSDPTAKAVTPYDVEFGSETNNLDKLIEKEAVAVSLGDSLWYVNTKWFKNNGFKGDVKRMRDYVPLYFSSKIAFIQWAGLAIPSWFISSEMDLDEFMEDPDIYVIDFDHKQVLRLDSELLSHLLNDYPDLKMRYEGMSEYYSRPMIAEFFLQYVNRVNSDADVLPLF